MAEGISDFAKSLINEGEKKTEWADTEGSSTSEPETKPSNPTPEVSSTPSIQIGTTTSAPATPAPALNLTGATGNSSVPDQAAILQGILGKIGDKIGSTASMKFMLHGEPGTFKSSFAATAPNNLVADLEDGLVSAYHSPHGVADQVRPYRWAGFEDFSKLIGAFMDNPPELDWVEVLTIDTFSELHKRGLAEVTEREWRKRPSTNRFVPETEHHMENNERMVRLIRALRDLNRDLIIVTHSKTVEPKGKPSKTYPDFSESLSNKIMGMMDVVGYAEKRMIDNEIKMVIKFRTDGGISCKSRIPLPDELINPTWADIKRVWEESKNL